MVGDRRNGFLGLPQAIDTAKVTGALIKSSEFKNWTAFQLLDRVAGGYIYSSQPQRFEGPISRLRFVIGDLVNFLSASQLRAPVKSKAAYGKRMEGCDCTARSQLTDRQGTAEVLSVC
jgi:hypothetical protein